MPRTKRAKCYRVSPYIKLETSLNDWVLQYRHNGYIVTRMIWIQAIKFTWDKQYEVEVYESVWTYNETEDAREIPDYVWVSFFVDDENDSDFEGF